MSTIVGKAASIIVVDDPHGYVVPFDGVVKAGVSLAEAGHVFRKSVFDRVVQEPGVFVKRVEPSSVIKGSKGRATKQHLKGLRP